MNIPELNKTYNVFDDGKVRESRRYEVIIEEIIPFSEIDKETLLFWKEEVKECYWLYREDTDFFIKTTENEIFVRTKNDGWFSMGFLNSGRLDIDGSLTSSIE